MGDLVLGLGDGNLGIGNLRSDVVLGIKGFRGFGFGWVQGFTVKWLRRVCRFMFRGCKA